MRTHMEKEKECKCGTEPTHRRNRRHETDNSEGAKTWTELQDQGKEMTAFYDNLHRKGKQLGKRVQKKGPSDGGMGESGREVRKSLKIQSLCLRHA